MSELDIEQSETMPLATDRDVVLVRHRVRDYARLIDLDLVSQTKIITAASELARNTVIHGHGGEAVLNIVRDRAALHPRLGLQLAFVDHGPGIADVQQAMVHGWSSGSGLGLGLPGSRQLVHEFELDTSPDTGTSVRVVFWRRDR